MVEGNIYQVKRGSAIITKPGEWHHCIYNSEDEHKLFWILFSPEGNERLFTKFLERKSGENNLICLSEKNSEALIEICRKLLHSPLSEVKKYMLFFELISYIEDASDTAPTGNIPCDVKDAISFINNNISSKITINQLAAHSLVSIKTLERHFIQYLKMSPADYTRYKKLITSAEMLQSGKSVTESAMDCGFCDTSNFICNFKKYFKMTPLEYKKKISDG